MRNALLNSRVESDRAKERQTPSSRAAESVRSGQSRSRRYHQPAQSTVSDLTSEDRFDATSPRSLTTSQTRSTGRAGGAGNSSGRNRLQTISSSSVSSGVSRASHADAFLAKAESVLSAQQSSQERPAESGRRRVRQPPAHCLVHVRLCVAVEHQSPLQPVV